MPGNKRIFVTDTVTTASKEQQTSGRNAAAAAVEEQSQAARVIQRHYRGKQTSRRNAAAKSNKVNRVDPIDAVATVEGAPRIRSTSLSWDSSALVPRVKLQKEGPNRSASPKASPAVTANHKKEPDAVIQIPQTKQDRALPQMQPEMELKSSQAKTELVLAAVCHESKILCIQSSHQFELEYVGNSVSQMVDNFLRYLQPRENETLGNSQSVNNIPHLVLVRAGSQGLRYCCLARGGDGAVSAKTASDFIQSLQTKFEAFQEEHVHATELPYETEFAPRMQQLMKDPRLASEVRLDHKIHQVQTKALDQIELLMKRSGQLDANLETVNELEKTSARYHKKTSQVKKKLCWKNCFFCC